MERNAGMVHADDIDQWTRDMRLSEPGRVTRDHITGLDGKNQRESGHHGGLKRGICR